MEPSFKVYSAGGCSYCGDSTNGSGYCCGCGSYVGEYECKVTDVETDQELFTVVGDTRGEVIEKACGKLRALKRQRKQQEQGGVSLHIEDPTPILAGLGLIGLLVGLGVALFKSSKGGRASPLTAPFDPEAWAKEQNKLIQEEQDRKHQEILASLPDDNHRKLFEQLWPAYERNLKEAMERGTQFAKSLPKVRV